MISDSKIIEIFCNLDDFVKEFEFILTKNSIPNLPEPKKRNRKSKMSKSEVMTIIVVFHLKSHRNLKHFYLHYVCKHMNDFFPELVSYNRFVELQKKVIQPLAVCLKMFGLGKCSGISFDNFFGNLIAGLVAYSFLDKKPSIKIQHFSPNIGVN